MSAPSGRPTLDQRDAFIVKLIGFRDQLTGSEQQLLDSMAVAALCRRPPDPARGYADVKAEELEPAADDSPWMQCYDRLPPERS
jgi:hypothetical protein